MIGGEQERIGIAKRLRIAREQAGLTQGQVAVKMGWHRPTVSQIEAGQRRISADELTALARHYGVSVSWLARARDPDEEPMDPAVELAARELARLKPQDLQRVIRLLNSLKNSEAG